MNQPVPMTPIAGQALPPAAPDESLEAMLSRTAVFKANTPATSLLIKASMAGVLLGLATCLSYLAMDGLPYGRARLMAGAVFPVGFMVIMLLRLELIAGNFALLGLGALNGQVSRQQMLRNWGWVYLGNFIGALLLAWLLMLAFNDVLHASGNILTSQLVRMAEDKTLAYQQAGVTGWASVFVKAILCNWLVALAVVLGIIIPSVPGKIVAAWLPLMNFMALGFEHAVVNLFVIPAGMLLGANIGIGQWLLWNFVPVTLGNLLGAWMVAAAIHYGFRQGG